MTIAAPSRTAAELLAVGQLFRTYDGERHALDVAREGGDLAALHARIGASIRREQGVRAWDRAAGVSIDARSVASYSITRLIQTQMTQAAAHAAPLPNTFDRNNAEVIADLQRSRAAHCFEHELASAVPIDCRMGSGVPVPFAALTRDFNVGTASEAGNLVASGTKDLTLTPDATRPLSALQALGALMPGGFRQTFSVPKIVTDQTNVAFVGEVAAATEGGPASGLVTFAPKRVPALLEVSKQAVIQGGAAMDMVITRMLFGKVMQVIEDAAINGDGTGDNPTGVRSTSGIATVTGGTNGAQVAWSHILDLENGPALVNAPESAASGYLVNAKTRRWLKNTQRASGLPFIWDGADRPLNGHRAAVTNNVPSNLTKGGSGAVCSSLIYSSDWSTLMVPIFGVPELSVDPFTKADSGQVRLILNVYVGCGVLLPAAFAKMDDALTA